MYRIATTLLFAGAFTGLAHYVLTHPNLDEVERLRRKQRQIERENSKLAERNERLRRKIEALRNDPDYAARHARQRSGLVRSDEVVLQFENDADREAMRVRLDVERGGMTLAGESTSVDDLSERLADVRDDVPSSILRVRFEEDVEPLRKAKVLEIVGNSAYEASEVETRDPSGS